MKRAATALAAFCICVLACAPSRAQSVVVNKYQNSGTTADIVELLVIQDSLDMRGMFLKDFSSNMANDGGGKYQLTSGGGKTIKTAALFLAATAKLNLSDNDLIADYSGASPIGTLSGSTYTGITGLIQTGRNGGTWNGYGIQSNPCVWSDNTIRHKSMCSLESAQR